mmetsp:Transcript_16443/g.35744  ORF Transcript_16443/g.35744 Transcript_16443/m.35744 type:complete len:81 (+) Transcript_16443:675-917(+)
MIVDYDLKETSLGGDCHRLQIDSCWLQTMSKGTDRQKSKGQSRPSRRQQREEAPCNRTLGHLQAADEIPRDRLRQVQDNQ